MSADLAQLVTSIAQRARAASLVLATTPAAPKNAPLLKLARLLQAPQLRASLRTAGLRRAAQFNWANTAHQTWQALQTAAQP